MLLILKTQARQTLMPTFFSLVNVAVDKQLFAADI